jgi:signal transduction histidine kinase
VHFEDDGVIRMVADRHSGSVAAAVGDRRDAFPELCSHVEEVARTGHAQSCAAELVDGRAAFHLCVPMCARGRSLGVLCFTRVGGSERRYERDDAELCEELGRRAAIAIDNARLYGMAQRAVRAREEFLTCAAHELRTPLVPLKLAVQGLLKLAQADESAALPQQRARLLASVDQATARLGALIEELLDLSRLVVDELVLSTEPVDLAEIVAGEVERRRSMLAGVGCPVRTEASGPTSGRWDREWLAKAFARLLSNAAKYGRGHPIELRLEGAPDRVRLVVRDQGIGIPAGELTRIFEKFERAVSSRHYGGFGFGLWSVRRIVEAHGGSIEVRSVPGEGATFILELPRSVPADAGDAIGHGAAGHHDAAPSRG